MFNLLIQSILRLVAEIFWDKNVLPSKIQRNLLPKLSFMKIIIIGSAKCIYLFTYLFIYLFIIYLFIQLF